MRWVVLLLLAHYAVQHVFPQGFPSVPVNWTLPYGGCLGTMYDPGFYQFSRNGYTEDVLGSQWWTTMDLNGDGLADLIVTSELGTDGYQHTFGEANERHWLVHLNNGTGFDDEPVEWPLPEGGSIFGSVFRGYWLTASGTAPNEAPGSQNWITRDMNGDARPDLVVYAERGPTSYLTEFNPESESYWNVYLNTGSGFESAAIEWQLPDGGAFDSVTERGFFTLQYSGAFSGSAGSQNWSVIDMDGDARPDLVVTGQKNSNGWTQAFDQETQPYWRIHRNIGNGFDADFVQWPLPDGGAIELNYTAGFNSASGFAAIWSEPLSNNWYTMDMTGDGLPDLVLTAIREPNGCVKTFSTGSGESWLVHVSDGTGFNPAAVEWNLPTGGAFVTGCTQGFYLDASEYSVPDQPGSQNWVTTDINGDRLTDMIVTAEAGSDDLVHPFSIGGTYFWKAHLGNGQGFATTATQWWLPLGGSNNPFTRGFHILTYTAFQNSVPGAQNWSTTDLNGDGWLDLVVTGERDAEGNNQEFSPESDSFWKVYLTDHTGLPDEIQTTSALECYPTPASESVYIRLPGNTAPGLLQVRSSDGRLLEELRMRGERAFVLDVHDIPSGTAFITWSQGHTRHYGRITVVH